MMIAVDFSKIKKINIYLILLIKSLKGKFTYIYCKQTRTKTSIRYAKENDREKERERKKGTRRDIERKGEIRE